MVKKQRFRRAIEKRFPRRFGRYRVRFHPILPQGYFPASNLHCLLRRLPMQKKTHAMRRPPRSFGKRARPAPIHLRGGTPELRNPVNRGSRSTI